MKGEEDDPERGDPEWKPGNRRMAKADNSDTDLAERDQGRH